MPRFKSNRWWTLILTLCLGIALVASVSSRATADPSIADKLGGIYEGGGGGKTRILQNGTVFEKAGVNFSAIEGSLPSAIAARMHLETERVFARIE